MVYGYVFVEWRLLRVCVIFNVRFDFTCGIQTRSNLREIRKISCFRKIFTLREEKKRNRLNFSYTDFQGLCV